jgi:hypothetical protein
MLTVRLPSADGRVAGYRLREPIRWPATVAARRNRIAYAAAHVVADPRAAGCPWSDVAIDWDATIAFREHLWGLGFKIAEAMDTAQRGMGLPWPQALELIRRSVAAARVHPGADLACGCGTDQLAPSPEVTLADVRRAYEEQIAAIEAAGGRLVLMASRALAACARSADDYLQLYGELIRQTREPVILHWLGDMFDPKLAGYWGSRDLDRATETFVALVNANAAKVDGVKISLLDKDREVALRPRLDPRVKVYTGDDFHYPELIRGDGRHHSHALLGIFDAIAPAAAAALDRLAVDDGAGFDAILAPTVPLSRTIFEAPTQWYKAGIVFLAWLNGHQDHFTMLGGMQSARSAVHFATVFRQADAAGLLRDPALAARRMTTLMALHGID